jgi:hypothetical protein
LSIEIAILTVQLHSNNACTGADPGREIGELAARLDPATHRLLQCIRQFDASNEWYAQGAVSCAHWLCWRIGLDQGTAREKVRVARALGTLPKLDDALRVGKLSYAKARALTRVAPPANEAASAGAATTSAAPATATPPGAVSPVASSPSVTAPPAPASAVTEVGGFRFKDR